MWKCLTAAAGVCAVSGVLLAQEPEPQGLGERIGEALDRGVRELGSELQEEWVDIRQSVDRLTVQGRVYSRVHWDKALATADIDIDVRDDAVVLQGTVPSAAAKQTAVRLAQDTVGVERVVDELTVAASGQ